MVVAPTELLELIFTSAFRLMFLGIIFAGYALFMRPAVRAYFGEEPHFSRRDRELRRNRCAFESHCANALFWISFSGTFGKLAGLLSANIGVAVTVSLAAIGLLFVWGAVVRWRGIWGNSTR
jgi:hypothetical protein